MKWPDLCEYVSQEPFRFDGVFVADYLLNSVRPERPLLITALGSHTLSVERGPVRRTCEFKFARSKLRMVCARVAFLLAGEDDERFHPYGATGTLGCWVIEVKNSNQAPISLAIAMRDDPSSH